MLSTPTGAEALSRGGGGASEPRLLAIALHGPQPHPDCRTRISTLAGREIRRHALNAWPKAESERRSNHQRSPFLQGPTVCFCSALALLCRRAPPPPARAIPHPLASHCNTKCRPHTFTARERPVGSRASRASSAPCSPPSHTASGKARWPHRSTGTCTSLPPAPQLSKSPQDWRGQARSRAEVFQEEEEDRDESSSTSN